MRCPRCGNDAPKDEYICSFCGVRLRMELIEKIPIFRRHEVKWERRQGTFKRLINVIIRPSRAFWDIKHQTDVKGPILIILFNAIILGIWALIAKMSITIVSYQGVSNNPTIYIVDLITGAMDYYDLIAMLSNIGIFLVYFIFGLVYFTLFFIALNVLFTLGANFSVNLTSTVKFRYRKQEEEQLEAAAKEIAKTGEMVKSSLQPRRPGKWKMMIYAYTPYIVSNFICAIILLIGILFSPSHIQSTSLYSYDFLGLVDLLNNLFDSFIWKIVDIIQIVTLIGWVPITMAISLRDLANTSTFRCYVTCLIVAIFSAYMMLFVRPTLNWNFHFIASQT